MNLTAEDILEGIDWLEKHGKTARTLDRARGKWRNFAMYIYSDADAEKFYADNIGRRAELSAAAEEYSRVIEAQREDIPEGEGTFRSDSGSGYGRHTDE